MVELYEAAVKSYPASEEILTQCFMAYVRVNDYQKQQQVSEIEILMIEVIKLMIG